jgi:hypothetical protein
MAGSIGYLSCDPGWRGLSLTLYIPSLKYTNTIVFKLNYTNNKAYKQPKNTIPLLIEQLKNNYLALEPRLAFVDKIILENQHRLNMQQLSWLIQAVLQSILPSKTKVIYISPLKCKRMFKIPLGANHTENKSRMLQYVINNKDDLIGGNTVTTHDSADSIILLNTYLKEKNRRVCKEVFCEVMSNLKLICYECNKATGKVNQCKKGDNSGRFFAACSNYKDGNKCGFGWFDGEPEEGASEYFDEEGNTWAVAGTASSSQKPKVAVGNKRKAAPAKKAPASKVAANTQTPAQLAFLREMKEAQAKFLATLPQIIKSIMEDVASSTDADQDEQENVVEVSE